MKPMQSIVQYLQYFKDKRLVIVFLFGIASGFPWVMIGSALSAWLSDEGVSRSSIGFVGVIFFVYSINYLWSPLIDRLKLPLLYRTLGLRRSWIGLSQLGIIGGCLLLFTLDPKEGMVVAGLFALVISISSATQDIAIDAYRIDIINQDEQESTAAAAAMATSGWWTGYAGLGAIAFFLADSTLTWPQIYLVLGGIMSLFLIVVAFAPEPVVNRKDTYAAIERQINQKLSLQSHRHPFIQYLVKVQLWVVVSFYGPIKDFFDRSGLKLALSLLVFILLFKLGEAFLGRMSVVFYKEIGFSNADIGFYSKLVSWWVTIAFSIIGSVFTMRFGIVRGLFVGGIAMSLSNLMFAWIALVGPDKQLFLAAVLVDGFTMAWSSVAVVAFISMLCNRAFSATQYALMASLSSLGRTVLGSSSGLLVDWLGGNWALFFVITTVMVIPSLLVLYFIKDDLTAIEKNYQQKFKDNE